MLWVNYISIKLEKVREEGREGGWKFCDRKEGFFTLKNKGYWGWNQIEQGGAKEKRHWVKTQSLCPCL